MGNASSSASAPKASSRKDDFMGDDTENAPLIESETQSERFIVDKSLMGIMINRAELRIRVRQSRQLRENEHFQNLMNRSERSDVAVAPPPVSSEFEAPASNFVEPPSSSEASTNGVAASTENLPSQPIHTPLPMPLPTAPVSDFSVNDNHTPLRDRLRAKRHEEHKKKREREPETDLEATPATPSVVVPTQEVTAQTSPPETTSESLTLSSLEVTPEQNERYSSILAEARMNILDAAQKRLDTFIKLEQTLEEQEQKIKSMPPLPPPPKKCASLEERFAACIHAAETIPDINARRLACAADRDLLMSCFKSQE